MIKKENNIDIIVTGLNWMKFGTRSIRAILEDMILSSTDEIQIVIYVISTGGNEFIDILADSLYKGIKVVLIINSLYSNDKEILEKLIKLSKLFNNFYLLNWDAAENEILHAKVIVVDRKIAFIGSSNLTWGGLTRNYEIGVKLEGPIVNKISELIDILGKDKKIQRVGH